MSFVQYIPETMMLPEMKEEVIALLRSLPIRYHIRKYTLLEWGRVMSVHITGRDVEILKAEGGEIKI